MDRLILRSLIDLLAEPGLTEEAVSQAWGAENTRGPVGDKGAWGSWVSRAQGLLQLDSMHPINWWRIPGKS